MVLSKENLKSLSNNTLVDESKTKSSKSLSMTLDYPDTNEKVELNSCKMQKIQRQLQLTN
jgi:hypothetical protein